MPDQDLLDKTGKVFAEVMKWFSMFSGIGGFELGLLQAGHQVVGGCEIDGNARSVYARHFPQTRLWEDATKLNPNELPDFEGICGGFPCQAFSIAGQRRGFEDTRGTLFFEIARIAKHKRPRILFLENVKGLLSHDDGRTFETILKTLDEIGYDAQWQVLNSKYFVPQNRERVFIIANLRETSRPEILPIHESETIPTQAEYREQKKQSGVWCEVSTIDARYGALRNAGETYLIFQQLDVSGKGHRSQQDRIYDPNGLMGCLAAHRTDSKTLISVDESVRKLTPIECERLQGFPDNWTSGIADTYRYKCLGNAVTVPVIEYLARMIN